MSTEPREIEVKVFTGDSWGDTIASLLADGWRDVSTPEDWFEDLTRLERPTDRA